MRYAVFGDTHGNVHALEAVLKAYQSESPDEFLCPGDLVGYGANPKECADATRQHDQSLALAHAAVDAPQRIGRAAIGLVENDRGTGRQCCERFFDGDIEGRSLAVREAVAGAEVIHLDQRACELHGITMPDRRHASLLR